MKSLFPDMDRDINEGRKAARREEVQRAREYLRKRDLSWLINELLEHGPKSEHELLLALRDGESMEASLDVLMDLVALWLVRKLWRRPLGVHPGSGEESFKYGLRGVHPLRLCASAVNKS